MFLSVVLSSIMSVMNSDDHLSGLSSLSKTSLSVDEVDECPSREA